MSEINANDSVVDTDDEMLPEYNFEGGVRGKHSAAYQSGYRIIIHKRDVSTEVQELTLPPEAILLDADVRAYFKDAKIVNQTLRGLIALLPKDNTVDKVVAL